MKNVKYPRPPSSRRSGLVGPYATPPVVNYEYRTSTLREGYFGLPIAQDYAPQGLTNPIIFTAFVGDKYYQSTFQVHVVTKGINHDGARAVGVTVAALVGSLAFLLMG